MIPKIIHYCWFGKNEIPNKLAKYINTWEKQCPDYQIIEWNESNFDITMFKFTEEAYKNKKYAFVSDVARVYALMNYGGIYLDTDVEVYKCFDEILKHKCVVGFEYKNWIATSFMAAEKGHPFIEEFYLTYQNINFLKNNGMYNLETNVEKITKMLEKRGLCRNNHYQLLDDEIAVYPKEYFSPYDYGNCILEKTEYSICVHHFLVSWLPYNERIKKIIKKEIVQLVGKKNLVRLRNIIRHQNEME